MTKHFWTIPVLTIYIYAITILIQFGYNNYFGIPYNFVEASITANTVYTYSLTHLFLGVLGVILAKQSVQIALVVFAFIVIAVIVAQFFIDIHIPNFKKLISGSLVILAIIFLWVSVSFGAFVAKTDTSFYVLSPACAPSDQSLTYIVPNFYDGKALVVPIDANRKMTGAFFIKDISQDSCQLQFKQVGTVSA